MRVFLFSIFFFIAMTGSLFSMPVFTKLIPKSCPLAGATDSAAFCDAFRQSAKCHCHAAGMPGIFCANMSFVYNAMIHIYGTLESACAHQHDTPKAICIDDWNCYRLGGKDSVGKLCSGTGRVCG